MNLEKYKEYRRIYPKIRSSWSLYKLWVKKDWLAVWQYLTDIKTAGTQKQVDGQIVHTWIEDNGWQSVDGIAKYLTKKRYKQEKTIEIERESHIIVARPDLYDSSLVLDWKTGHSNGYEQQLQLYMWTIGDKCNKGLLAEIDSIWEGESIKGVVLKRVKEYERSKYASDWEYRLEEMANDIINHLKYLNRYLEML
jgi:hypothetical protein